MQNQTQILLNQIWTWFYSKDKSETTEQYWKSSQKDRNLNFAQKRDKKSREIEKTQNTNSRWLIVFKLINSSRDHTDLTLDTHSCLLWGIWVWSQKDWFIFKS